MAAWETLLRPWGIWETLPVSSRHPRGAEWVHPLASGPQRMLAARL